MKVNKTIAELTINSIRMLGIQAVNQANSGHPGIVLGAAPMVYTLFAENLHFNPKNPRWFNRDRFILSAGHGSALLYSLLYHAGYDYKMTDMINFRQLHSKTPGHPEFDLDLGVELATGPLGQGISTAVGFALSESFLAAKFNKPECQLIDHYTYVLSSDGDFQEGVTQEAMSLAGLWKLNKLIVLYDSNNVQLDSDTKIVYSDHIKERMKALNWNYHFVANGNDIVAIDEKIKVAQQSERPTLIEINTIIGYGATKAGTSAVHGAPLGKDIEHVKANLQWNYPDFTIPEKVITSFQQDAIVNGEQKETLWNQKLAYYQQKYQNDYQLLLPLIQNKNIEQQKEKLAQIEWSKLIDQSQTAATRVISGQVLKILSQEFPLLIGGSADLAGSTKALVYDESYSATNKSGRHIHYGVREHGMGLIVNGLTLNNLLGFGATFLVFSDYMKPALRAAAIMKIPSLFIFSHDSVAVGEDGPTHEPIEQLNMLRLIPNFNVIRPCDTREVIGAYQLALQAQDYPSAIILTRQDVPAIAKSESQNVAKGGYIISPELRTKPLTLTLIATGSEVHLAIAVQQLLLKSSINARVVSMPATFIFNKQPKSYQEQVLGSVVKVAIELGATMNWYQYVGTDGLVIGLDHFGCSAPMKDILTAFNFNQEKIYQQIIQFYQTKEKK